MKTPACRVPAWFSRMRLLACAATGLFSGLVAASANSPGGGTGKGPDVTVRDNGDGTATMANGICGFADNLSVSPAEMSKRPLPVPSQTMTWYEQVMPYRRGQIAGQ